MTLFQTIKQSITAKQAAEYYGLDIGTNGLYRCPFHYGRHPGMKVDDRYYCFGSGATGDSPTPRNTRHINQTASHTGCLQWTCVRQGLRQYHLFLPQKLRTKLA